MAGLIQVYGVNGGSPALDAGELQEVRDHCVHPARAIRHETDILVVFHV